jgi:hypothetical protein
MEQKLEQRLREKFLLRNKQHEERFKIRMRQYLKVETLQKKLSKLKIECDGHVLHMDGSRIP